MIINPSEEDKKYIGSHLIAYIGSKRRLLPLIKKAFSLLDLDPQKKKLLFYDPFAGTGVISRLAKTLGFQVIANDWESYSQVINKVYLEIDHNEIDELYKEHGGLTKLLRYLNELPAPAKSDLYIAKYYCPKNSEYPDLKNERLFYTKESGEKIDAIRKTINNLYPNPKTKKANQAKALLLSLLLYESSTRANTSGVFKAFHKGFGGTGKDALTRILKPLALPYPTLYNGKHKNKVFKACANRLTTKLKSRFYIDVAYIDPPYNQHQYGSNYHLLNTIALDDKPPVREAIYINGKKVDKSAIRKDWIKTRSTYCYKQTAHPDFVDLINNLNAHYILVSYSIDGIVPFDEMLKLLSGKGKLSIITSEYTKYRGGKQSLTTEKSNIEFLLMVDTEKEANPNDIIKVKEELIDQKANMYLKKNVDLVNCQLCNYQFSMMDKGIKIFEKKYGDYLVKLFIEKDFRFADSPKYTLGNEKDMAVSLDSWETLPVHIKESFVEDIFLITSMTKDREIEVLLKLIENIIYIPNKNGNDPEKEILDFYKKIPTLLKKFNNRKAYIKSLQTIQQILETTILIRAEYPKLYYSKSFYHKLNRLKKIIEDKINHKPIEDRETADSLKNTVKDQYYNTIGAA